MLSIPLMFDQAFFGVAQKMPGNAEKIGEMKGCWEP